MYFLSHDRIPIVTRVILLSYLFLLFAISIVSGMRFKKQPQGGVITPGDTVTLRCAVNQPYATDIYWRNVDKDMYLSQNTFISPERQVDITLLNERYSIVGNQDKGEYFLKIIDFTADDEGRYACEFFMNDTHRSRIAELRIATPPDEMYPICTMQPTGPYAVGDTVTLNCESVGGTPPASLALRRGSVILRIYLPFGNLPDSVVTHTFTLSESDVNRRYTCVARHPALTNPRSCSFMPLRDRIGVYLRPLVAKVMERENTMFTCISERLPNLTFTWYIDDDTVDGTNPLLQIDHTGQRLLLYNVTMRLDFSLVSCEVIQVGPGYRGIATSLVSVTERPVENSHMTTVAPVSTSSQGIPSVTPFLDGFSGSGSGDGGTLFSTNGVGVSTGRTIPVMASTTMYKMTDTTKSSVPSVSTSGNVTPKSKVATTGLEDAIIRNQLEEDYRTSSSNSATLSSFHSREYTGESRSEVVEYTVTSEASLSSDGITERPKTINSKVKTTLIPLTSVSMGPDYSENANTSEETTTYGWDSPTEILRNVSTPAAMSTEPLSSEIISKVTINERLTSDTGVSNGNQTVFSNMNAIEEFTVKTIKNVTNVKNRTETSTHESRTISNEVVSTEAFSRKNTSTNSHIPIATEIMTTVKDVETSKRTSGSTTVPIAFDEDVNTAANEIVSTKTFSIQRNNTEETNQIATKIMTTAVNDIKETEKTSVSTVKINAIYENVSTAIDDVTDSTTLTNELQSNDTESSNAIATKIMTTLKDLKKTERIKASTETTFDEDVRNAETTVVVTNDVTNKVTSMVNFETKDREEPIVPTTTAKVMTSFKPSTDSINRHEGKDTEPPEVKYSSMTLTAVIGTSIKTTTQNDTESSTPSLRTNIVGTNSTDENVTSGVSNTSNFNETLRIGNGGKKQPEIPNDTNFVEKNNFVDPNSSKTFSFNQMNDKFWHYAIIVTTVAVLCISIVTITSVVIISRRIGSEQAATIGS